MSDKEPRRRKKRKDTQRKEDIRSDDQIFMTKSDSKDSDQETEDDYVITTHQPSKVAKLVFVLLFSGLVVSMSFVFISLQGVERGSLDVFDGSHDDVPEVAPENYEADLSLSTLETVKEMLFGVGDEIALNDQQTSEENQNVDSLLADQMKEVEPVADDSITNIKVQEDIISQESESILEQNIADYQHPLPVEDKNEEFSSHETSPMPDVFSADFEQDTLTEATQDYEPESTIEYYEPESTTEYFEPESTAEYFEPESITEYFEPESITEYFEPESSTEYYEPDLLNIMPERSESHEDLPTESIQEKEVSDENSESEHTSESYEYSTTQPEHKWQHQTVSEHDIDASEIVNDPNEQILVYDKADITNEEDYEIRQTLDDVDEMLEKELTEDERDAYDEEEPEDEFDFWQF